MADNSPLGEPYCICRSYEDSRFMICCDRCNKWFHGDCVRVKEEEAKKIRNFYCPPCQKANPALQTIYQSEPPSPAVRDSGSPKTQVGIPASASAPSLLAKGISQITTSSASSEKRSPATAEMTHKSSEPSAKRSKLAVSDLSSGYNCGNCIGCFRKENCGRCDACKKEDPSVQSCLLRRCVNIQPVQPKKYQKDLSETESSEDDEPYVERRRRGGASRGNPKLKNVGSRGGGRAGRPPKQKSQVSSPGVTTGGTRASARAYRNFLKDAGVLPNSDDEASRPKKTAPRQCYGPGCIYAARSQSKYCSDECGMKLAQLRIQELLPSRLHNCYARRPVAEELEKRRLERIHAEHETGRARLVDLDKQERELNDWREKCKVVRLKENDGGKFGKSKAKNIEPDDPDTSVYCVTCGNETSMKNAIKHFAKCFSKYESQTSYGSSFKAVNNLYNIFCDTYNKTNRTYCKRLRVICPEHSKDPKAEAHETCGCPLQSDKNFSTTKFELVTSCAALKKNCTKHYKWMQIRHALIDMERLTQLLRLEELAEETRCIQMAQNSRGSLLALLLHQTTTHDGVNVKIEQKDGEELRNPKSEENEKNMNRDHQVSNSVNGEGMESASS